MKKIVFFCLFLISLEARGDLFDHATVSYYAVHMPSGKVLLDQNSDKSLVPASCMKLVTTGAALSLLGSESVFQTDLAYDGFIDKEGVLQGDLYVVGGGDPSLGSDRFGSSYQKQLSIWVSAVIAAGIKKINGKIVGDPSIWEEPMAVPSWQWEDLGNYYGAGASGLSFHENMYFLFLKSGSEIGEAASLLRTDPDMSCLILKNQAKTAARGSGDQVVIYGSEVSFEQKILGTMPIGEDFFVVKGAIPNPSILVSLLLKAELQKCGILVLEESLENKKEKTVIHTTYSPCLSEIVYETNQNSINLFAEHLLKKMGGGSLSGGIKKVFDFWREQSIDVEGFYMADGSGLSRKNLITTKQLVSMLLFMNKSKEFSSFKDSLVKTGSVSGKSGFMSLIRAYSGYVNDIAFCIIINQCPDGAITKCKIQEFINSLQALSVK